MSTSPQAALDLVILKTLDRGPNHGFGITLHIEQASGNMLKVEEGSLYPALHRLERTELVTADWTKTENGRRARIYSLTPAGRKRLREAEQSWSQLSTGVAKVLSFS
ncbi:MAG: PadR family transcriptional regulator [Acidobacteria bacterium]|nr:PadR family transcriptional regulator [Acidobacteriota bacterium]